MTHMLNGLAASLFLVALSCSSESDVGEECDQAGGTSDVCDEGTVCGWPSDKSRQLVCIPRCVDGNQCPKDYECKEAVEKSPIKGCRLKD